MSLFAPTHAELVALGARWLQRSPYKNGFSMAGRCPVVVSELSTSAFEQPDVIGWHSGRSILIEVKVSRSDFHADAKKSFRVRPEKGLGEYRWYLCPEGMVLPEEVPAKWGLLWAMDSGRVRVMKDPELQECDRKAEAHILISVIRRLAGWSPLHLEGRTASREPAEVKG